MKTIKFYRQSYVYSDDCDMRGGTSWGETPWRLTPEEALADDVEFCKDIDDKDEPYVFTSYEKIELPIDLVKKALAKVEL